MSLRVSAVYISGIYRQRKNENEPVGRRNGNEEDPGGYPDGNHDDDCGDWFC